MRSLSRALVPATFIALATAPQAQVKAVLYEGGKQTGTATLNAVVRPSGNLVMSMHLSSTKAGDLQITESYEPSGMPIQETLFGTKGSQRIKLVVTFGTKSTKVTATVAGQTHSQEFPYPKGANLREKSSFWFVTTRPHVGEVNAYSDFDIATMRWQAKSAKYVGEEKLKYHGKVVLAHKIDTTNAISWVDDKGLPYRVQNKKSNDLVVRV